MPDRAYFGKKDYQQWVIIRRMAADLRMDVEIIGCPTVREESGLALSSRNLYLDGEERKSALGLRRALLGVAEAVEKGEGRTAPLVEKARKVIERSGLRTDYAAVVHPDTLEDLERIEGPVVVLAAAWCGKTRLIDNIELPPPSPGAP
jgi:pantoate--beta-alanine ligase